MRNALLLGLVLAQPLAAQERIERFELAADPVVAPVVIADSTTQRSVILLGAGGIAGGAVLGLAGAFAGYVIGCGTQSVTDPDMPSSDYCGVIAFPGFVLGDLIGMPLGVWLADGRRGSFGADLVASLGGLIVGGGAAILIGGATGSPWLVAPVIPLTQLIAVVATERATADAD